MWSTKELVMRNKKKFNYNSLDILLAAISSSFIVYFICDAIYQSEFSWSIDFGNGFTNLPGYLAFFAAVISVYLLLKTLRDQKLSNKISAFENRFFKFIDYHRENVNIINYKKPNCKKEEFVTGKKFFIVATNEIRDLIKAYIDFNRSEDPEIPINFIYLCYFYGAWADRQELLKNTIIVREKFRKKDG